MKAGDSRWKRFGAAMVLTLASVTVQAEEVPRFEVEAAWPKQLPNDWILGQIAGIAVDANDHIWVYQRPGTLTDEEQGAATTPKRSKCCRPAPPVLEFDADGNLLRSWGGPGGGFEWPAVEHGISVSPNGNLWLGGNGKSDSQLLEFTPDGVFVRQIGRAGTATDSNDERTLNRPALAITDGVAGEIYVADGYGNRRVLVLDSASGTYRRHWGAYGKRPADADPGPFDPDTPTATQFRTPVHCVRLSNDRLVYVCDRNNNRIQVFRPDGEYVTEFVIEPRTRGLFGAVFDIAFSTDAQQTYLFVADGANSEIHVVRRRDGAVLSHIGHGGRQSGQFHWLHVLAIDSRGNLYTGEVDTGKRVQKFRRLP
ncbi:MAG: hypothetical protein U1F52_18665 [Burkholderiales bacterium]